MSVNCRIAEALEKLTFEHREADYSHHTYEEDMGQYELVKRGDMRALEVGRRMFGTSLIRHGHWPSREMGLPVWMGVSSVFCSNRIIREPGQPPSWHASAAT